MRTKDRVLRFVKRGSVVRRASVYEPTTFVVDANYGEHLTAVASVDISNPPEWEILGDDGQWWQLLTEE